MFQDDFASDDSANVFEGYTGEEATEELHPAILAAIVIGCITAGFALLTWYLNSCVQFRRMRLRRRRDEEANDPPGGPNTLEQKPSDYIPNNNTLDGASERDREQSAPTSTRGTRRPEPIANPNRTASGPMHDSQSLPNTLPQTPVVLLGPLAVLGCFSMMPPQRGSPPQLDMLPATIHQGNCTSNESTHLTPLATHAEPSTHRIDFTPTLLSMHASLWIYIGIVCFAIANSCPTCIDRGAWFCWHKSDDQRCQSLNETASSATQQAQPLAGINDEASQIGRKPIVLAGAASRPQQNWYIEGG